MLVMNFNVFTFKPSIDSMISSFTLNNSRGISITLLNAGIGDFLVDFPFMEPTSGPNAFSARFTSSVVISIFLIKFILIIAFRSCVVGVPTAWKTFRAAFALFLCLLDIYLRLSVTTLVI